MKHLLLQEPTSLAKILAHKHVLLAVSGGSDSLAMLYLFSSCNVPFKISVATVNHKLRTEAKMEAEMVAKICQQLNLPHEILSREILNKPVKNNSAQNARNLRYELLATHAKKINATAIITAHTQNDQAETILMRAARLTPTSNTIGLSAISPCVHYKTLQIIRPLLQTKREALQNFLTKQNIKWINDPSNKDKKYERTRMRDLLKTLPSNSITNLARFADLCNTSRLWLNRQTVLALEKHVRWHENKFILTPPPHLPDFILSEMLTLLVRLISASLYRPSLPKLADSIKALQNKTTCTKTAAKAIIKVKNGTAHIYREKRKTAQPAALPDLTTFRYFRPRCDDCLYEWAKNWARLL